MRRSLDPSAAVPTEDTIAALVEHFVAPLLPIRDFYTEKPSDQKQEMVAKQVFFSLSLSLSNSVFFLIFLCFFVNVLAV